MTRLHPRKSGGITGMQHRIKESLQPAAAWWSMLTSRERRFLGMGALVLGATLLWLVGMKPAIDSIAQSRERLPRLQADAIQIDALVLEAQTLLRHQSGRLEPAAIPDALRESLRRAGLEASLQVRSLNTPGASNDTAGIWEVEVADASADRVMLWLDALPGQFNVRISSAALNRSRVEGRDRPGRISGRITLQAATVEQP